MSTLKEAGYVLRWNALLGPLPTFEPTGLITTPNDNSRRLSGPCTIGPLTVLPGDRPFVEYRRLEPQTLEGRVEHRSWPVLVEGVQSAATEMAAVRQATRLLHRLTCLLALAWSEPWQVRTAPQNSSRLPARVPDSDPLPSDWMPPVHLPQPEEVELPSWVRDGWEVVNRDAALAAALTSWHQGILLQSAHPCLALVAYVGTIEQMAHSPWTQSELERQNIPPTTGSASQFKQTTELVATEEELTLLHEMRAYGLRSKSAHGAPIVGIETSYGATIPLTLAEHVKPDGNTTVSMAIDTTEPSHAFMIKLVPAARRVAGRLLRTALGDA